MGYDCGGRDIKVINRVTRVVQRRLVDGIRTTLPSSQGGGGVSVMDGLVTKLGRGATTTTTFHANYYQTRFRLLQHLQW